MEWMILPLKRYFDFKGRSRRKEFWMFWLFSVIGQIVFTMLDTLLGLRTEDGSTGALVSIFSLLIFIPGLAVAVRRLHDTDRSGWWYLLPFATAVIAVVLLVVGGVGLIFGGGGAPTPAFMIPIIIAVLGCLVTSILLLVWYCTDGTRGPNRFGDDPKNPVGDVEDVFG